MSILRGKHILLGITAGIAAYKTASLVRLFIKVWGFEVKVIMTPAAKEFITPLSRSRPYPKTLSFRRLRKPTAENAVWNNHVELGLWADLFLSSPS